jgi:peptidoglycan/xylan/chitin deacetylase (PgdA/CDA1 family)
MNTALKFIKENQFLHISLIILLLFAFFEPAKIESQAQEKSNGPSKQIAITFDGLPATESFSEVDAAWVMNRMMAALDSHKVEAVGFVIGKNIGDNYDLLGEWLNHKHKIGNMTFTGSDYNEMSIESFIQDIREGGDALEMMLTGVGQKERYFRYPYLHYGMEPESKRQAKLFLQQTGTVISHATVLVEDYLYNLSFQKLDLDDTVAVDNLAYEYISHLLDQITSSEQAARELVGRRCRQILRLNANPLNAYLLDEILLVLEEEGYSFISLDKALSDKVFKMPEGYVGMRGVGYLDMLLLTDPDLLPAQ